MKAFITKCKSYFVVAAIFSLFINVLMLAMPIYMMQVFDRVITSRSLETLSMLTIAVLGAYILHLFLDLFRGRVLLGAGIALDGMAGPPVLTSVLSSFARPGSDAQVAGLKDVATLRGFLTGHGIFSLFDLPWMPIFIAVIFMFHPVMGITACCGAITLFTLAFINEKATKKPLAEMSLGTRRASRYIDASMRNIEVASALGMIDNLIRRWRKVNDQVIDAQVIAGRRAAVLSGLTRFTRLSLQIVMLGIGAYLVIQQHVSPGVMMAGTLILSRALAPIESAIHTWKGFVDAREAYGRLSEMLGEAPPRGQRTQLPAPEGRLTVDRITFGIPGQDRLIIKGVSFSLEPGESMGLIGPSAAGKSTLARLVTGIWRPASGNVRLDGADVSVLPREHLGPHLGYVPQDVELFSGTVGENIARLQEKFEAGQVIDAAQRAHAHDMIVQLPKAYDTEIGDSGASVSAGQRQRIALARALFGRPRLVVLDEPNANLDSEGEEALVQTLRGLKREGATVITVSHRPSLLANVDKLLVLRDGQVEMYGPRADVVAKLKTRIAVPGESGPVPITGRQLSGA